MFVEERDYYTLKWEMLGDVEAGRPNLGLNVPVNVYRLMQFSLRDALITDFGVDQANDLFNKAGRNAGIQFCKNLLDTRLPFNDFMTLLERTLEENRIGILKIEEADLDTMQFTLTVGEDLDCSGLSPTDEVVCQYDEGFIAGILEEYTGKTFTVREVDCWANGDNVCRFDVSLTDDGIGL